MKKIGFIDYYISEWHANNYPNWIMDFCKKNNLDYRVAYAWAKKDVSPVDSLSTAQWCAKYDVAKCESIQELCEKSDNIIILAPSDPQTHLEFAIETFKFCKGKCVYIDKTFAPDYSTAVQIYQEAEKYGVKFFSTSALRYADELNTIKNICSAEIFGGGDNFEEYIIHQIEILVRLMGIGMQALDVIDKDGSIITEVKYADGRKAVLNFKNDYPFKIVVDDKVKKTDITINSAFFLNLIGKIITFFENGNIDFSMDETLEVMKIRETAITLKNKNR